MSTWGLIQVVFDIFGALGIFTILMRMSRQPKDDPRLSRGLQLLQSKISVLEDLSDRTENQVNQLTAILDQKAREVQAKVQLAEQHVHELRVSMERSLEVAKIFQDKIPHQEIIERQNTIKYVQAARLAHQGMSVEEIAQKVDLPKGEIEFIAKVNREQLMFNEDQLPPWAQEAAAQEMAAIAPTSQIPNVAVPQPTLGDIAFQEPTETSEEQTARIRMEMEIAERQRLVENLSRLQFEMQNLDMQLARENHVRDLSGAFEVPKVETENLQKLGEEFRKACEEAKEKEERSSFLPPLDQLKTVIPQIFSEVSEQFAQATRPQQPVPQAAAPAPQVQPQPTMPAAPTQTQAAEPPRDPVLARAAAQAKVQAALAKGRASQTANTQPSTNPDLQAARALAREQQSPVTMASPSAGDPVVRRVQFPRIDSPKG